MARDLDVAMADQPDVPVSVLYLRFLGWLGPRPDPDNPPEATRPAERPPGRPAPPPTSGPPERPRSRLTESEFDEPTQ